MKATGNFEVTLNPLDTFAKGLDEINLGRMSIDKIFQGDLDATSKGEMLSAMTSVKGSAGYVAVEQVSGKLHGKQGSFVLQHFGTMHGDNQFLKVEVVPDSGSGELKGITGQLIIDIKDGHHFYTFNYQL